MGGVAALICAISFALLMLTGVFVVLKLARTMTITNAILNDIRKEALPLLTKVETTMDHVNAEMGYVEGVLKSVEKMADRANSMTRAAQQLVSSPIVKLLTLGVGVQKALGLTHGGKGTARNGSGEE